MLSSRLISNANRTISDIDQVIESLSSGPSNTDNRAEEDDEAGVVHSGNSSNACAVERYPETQGEKSAFHLYSSGELAETYTQQLQYDEKGLDEDTPISSIWETRWFDHAALVGRFMAEDKIHSDHLDTNSLQYIPAQDYTFPIEALPDELERPPTQSGHIPVTTELRNRGSLKNRDEGGAEGKNVADRKGAESDDESPRFKCRMQDCQAAFSTPSQRWYHYKSVHTEIQLQCPECQKIFVKVQQLEVHLRSHLKLKMYKCREDGCDKSFLTQQQCNNHMLIHSGEKNFECTVCNRRFREKSTLKRHSRTHTKIKLYRCEVCHKSFSYASSLTVHKKHFHSPSIRNPKPENPSEKQSSKSDSPVKESCKSSSTRKDASKNGKQSEISEANVAKNGENGSIKD